MKKKNKLGNLKKDKLFIINIVAIIDVIVAFFAFIERICFIKCLTSYMDMGLESDVVVTSIYTMDILTFDSIFLILIAIFMIIGIDRKEKGLLLSSVILTVVVAISSLSFGVINYLQNPFESVW